LNKAELRESVQKSLECPAATAERTVNAVIDAIVDGLQKDGVVQLMGFGTFQVKERAARVGRNPATGAPLEIPASRTVNFRPGRALKDNL
jgi:DNA-binding protein HU-beta